MTRVPGNREPYERSHDSEGREDGTEQSLAGWSIVSYGFVTDAFVI